MEQSTATVGEQCTSPCCCCCCCCCCYCCCCRLCEWRRQRAGQARLGLARAADVSLRRRPGTAGAKTGFRTRLRALGETTTISPTQSWQALTAATDQQGGRSALVTPSCLRVALCENASPRYCTVLRAFKAAAEVVYHHLPVFIASAMFGPTSQSLLRVHRGSRDACASLCTRQDVGRLSKLRAMFAPSSSYMRAEHRMMPVSRANPLQQGCHRRDCGML